MELLQEVLEDAALEGTTSVESSLLADLGPGDTGAVDAEAGLDESDTPEGDLALESDGEQLSNVGPVGEFGDGELSQNVDRPTVRLWQTFVRLCQSSRRVSNQRGIPSNVDTLVDDWQCHTAVSIKLCLGWTLTRMPSRPVRAPAWPLGGKHPPLRDCTVLHGKCLKSSEPD